MQNRTPGNAAPVNVKYTHKDFPKRVYGASLDDYKTVNSPDEIPDGYMTLDDFNANAEAGAPKADAEKEAQAAAKQAAKLYRAEIRAYLDEHDVEYAKNCSTETLESLKVQLDEHLEKQAPENDAQ